MKDKFKIMLFLIVGVTANAFCCLMATQERILPLGINEGCLIGIEVISNRYGEGNYGEKEMWNYTFKLKGFNEDYSDFLIQELSKEEGIETEKILKTLEDRVSKALQICQQLKDFEILVPKDISFCDFQKSCSNLSLIKSEEEIRFRIKNENKDHPIYYLSSDYKGAMANPYKDYFEFYFEGEIVGIDLKFSSIRKYENSSYQLLMFHLGTGQEFDETVTGKPIKKEETPFEKELKTIEDAIFIEPILHHGKGFDYFKLSKK